MANRRYLQSPRLLFQPSLGRPSRNAARTKPRTSAPRQGALGRRRRPIGDRHIAQLVEHAVGGALVAIEDRHHVEQVDVRVGAAIAGSDRAFDLPARSPTYGLRAVVGDDLASKWWWRLGRQYLFRALAREAARIEPTDQSLHGYDGQRTFDVVGHGYVDRVPRSEIDSFEKLSGDRDLTIRPDAKRSVRCMHTTRLQNLVDFVVMENDCTLAGLIADADRLDRHSKSWLLDASTLAVALGEAVLQNPETMEKVRGAVRATATAQGCDFIVGASGAADQVVRTLNGASSTPPKRVLLFEIARVTGATLAQSSLELRPSEVIAAVLIDMQPARRSGRDLLTVLLPELVRS